MLPSRPSRPTLVPTDKVNNTEMIKTQLIRGGELSSGCFNTTLLRRYSSRVLTFQASDRNFFLARRVESKGSPIVSIAVALSPVILH
jgi:hypothetical protein